MTSQEIRNGFLDYFRSKQHTIVSSAPVVPYEDPTLLFTNAGMNQFKDVFLATGRRDYTRAADTQKCIRVSGKHNDLEEVGRDTYHHTFFEMLGNWSFGDYYKKEAIAWAWELLTKVWGIPKNRLWATVYKDDAEAEELWKTVTDIDPAHVLRFGEKDNFWEMGETGPCGPCSEIHIDRTPEGNAVASMVNAGLPELMEIWNLVFIQYNRDASGVLTPLPAKHVDTGMGFERICAVLQGRNSNYDTDVFTPIIARVAELTKKPYNGSLDPSIGAEQIDTDTAMRVIADHVRTLTFAIGDGALPSNEGRGYVLRRILRRAARFGRNLGMQEPFIYQLVPTLVETMSYVFPEIKGNQEHIQRIIRGEEDGFNATLDNGLKIFEDVTSRLKTVGSTLIPGEDAFRLYDTFGFPLDLTQLMAQERGFTVDEARFSDLLEQQRERSRDSGKVGGGHSPARFTVGTRELPKSHFIGYTDFETDHASIQLAADGYLILDRTPFYAESGGQLGDTGEIIVDGASLHVVDTQKDGGVFAHKIDGDIRHLDGRSGTARIDRERRLAIMRNHTATHLVHEALRRVLGTHLHQAGSLVAPDHLRFDFNHFEKVTPEQLKSVEGIVNERIAASIAVAALNDPGDWVSIEEAKKRWPNVKMFFGEKYGDRVRVVEIDPQFSVELCGGTHVGNTGEIGYFKFRSEGSVAAGVRRIEAVTAGHALELLQFREHALTDRAAFACQRLEEIADLISELKWPDDVIAKVEKRIHAVEHGGSSSLQPSRELDSFFSKLHTREHELESIILEIAETRKGLERELSRIRLKAQSGSMDGMVDSAPTVNGFRVAAASVSAGSVEELKTLGDTLRARLGSGVGLLASVIDEKVALVCVVTDDLVASKRADAGKLVGAVAKQLGGGGGGRASMATAGGRDVPRMNESLNGFAELVKGMSR